MGIFKWFLIIPAYPVVGIFTYRLGCIMSVAMYEELEIDFLFQ
jgi:hypothetical protein